MKNKIKHRPIIICKVNQHTVLGYQRTFHTLFRSLASLKATTFNKLSNSITLFREFSK